MLTLHAIRAADDPHPLSSARAIPRAAGPSAALAPSEQGRLDQEQNRSIDSPAAVGVRVFTAPSHMRARPGPYVAAVIRTVLRNRSC